MPRFLIVEDEPLIAMMIEDYAETLGHECVGTTDNVSDALAAVAKGGFDLAILDVTLRDGERSWPVADALAEASIPFVFATGGQLDSPPDRHSGRPCVTKPFTLGVLQEVCDNAVAK